ncbi:MAG: ABC transporter permease [Thermoplasmata archaeon]|nr:MAG: ABC transporter permease [Thermoplasmata archaeon]
MNKKASKAQKNRTFFLSFFKVKKNRDRLIHLGISILAVIIFILAWDLYAQLQNKPYLPRPHMVFDALIASFFNRDPFSQRYMGEHILASMVRILYGFIIAFILAVPLGLLMGWSKHVHNAGNPIVELIRPIPPIAWIPFAIVFFDEPFDTAFIVFLGIFFPVLINTIFGVKRIDPIIIDAAKTLGVTKRNMLQKVIFPAVIPTLMTGIRIGLGIGWMCIVAAEMVGVTGGGVGFYISAMADVGRYDDMFAGMIVIGILGFITVGGASYIERRVSRWMGMR